MTRVLWPKCEDYYTLMTVRASEGRASFDSEKQNEPVNPEDCYFQESDFQYWDDEYDSVEHLIDAINGRYVIVGACDPSIGRQGRRGDDSAVISILRDTQSGHLYVIDADIRSAGPKILQSRAG